jgi:hypothetical protein
LIQVPVLTPRLSSYWVNLVTPIKAPVAQALIEGLRHETVCESDIALRMFSFRPAAIERAVRQALGGIGRSPSSTAGGQAAASPSWASIDPTHFLIDGRTADAACPPQVLFDCVAAIGGATGWYYADWLWKLRGWIDRRLGGPGLGRGRRHPRTLEVNDIIDCWIVEEYVPGARLLLRAEMRVWGWAWLEFRVGAQNLGAARLTQTAYYYPRGLTGIMYWYAVYPIHALVFRGMARAIVRKAEKDVEHRASNR